MTFDRNYPVVQLFLNQTCINISQSLIASIPLHDAPWCLEQ